MSSIPVVVVPRTSWLARAHALAWLTIGYNIAEGVVAMGFGAADDSLALFGFGVDSFIEVASAGVVLWRLRGEGQRTASRSRDRERLATRIITALLAVLGLGVVLGGVAVLVTGSHPETTLPGVLISLASLALMAFLWRGKVVVARGLGSKTVQADAACSFACMQLSVVLLAGSLVYAVFPVLWFADGVVSLVLGGLIAREGILGFRAASAKDFDGGCCGGCSKD